MITESGGAYVSISITRLNLALLLNRAKSKQMPCGFSSNAIYERSTQLSFHLMYLFRRLGRGGEGGGRKGGGSLEIGIEILLLFPSPLLDFLFRLISSKE